MEHRDILMKWFEREGFTLENDCGRCYTRTSKYYISANLDDEKPAFGVMVYDDDDSVDLFFSGRGKKYGIDVWVRGVPITSLQAVGRGYEHRLADAWNDINS